MIQYGSGFKPIHICSKFIQYNRQSQMHVTRYMWLTTNCLSGVLRKSDSMEDIQDFRYEARAVINLNNKLSQTQAWTKSIISLSLFTYIVPVLTLPGHRNYSYCSHCQFRIHFSFHVTSVDTTFFHALHIIDIKVKISQDQSRMSEDKSGKVKKGGSHLQN